MNLKVNVPIFAANQSVARLTRLSLQNFQASFRMRSTGMEKVRKTHWE
jgi:hypothetical protein